MARLSDFQYEAFMRFDSPRALDAKRKNELAQYFDNYKSHISKSYLYFQTDSSEITILQDCLSILVNSKIDFFKIINKCKNILEINIDNVKAPINLILHLKYFKDDGENFTAYEQYDLLKKLINYNSKLLISSVEYYTTYKDDSFQVKIELDKEGLSISADTFIEKGTIEQKLDYLIEYFEKEFLKQTNIEVENDDGGRKSDFTFESE